MAPSSPPAHAHLDVALRDAAGAIEVLVFEVDQHRHAIPSALVSEIVRAVAIAPLPTAPLVVRGVVNVRGQLAAVVDLRRRFGWPDRPLDPWEHFLVLRAAPRPLVLRADRVLGPARIPAGALEPSAAVVPGAGHVAGLARLPDGLLLVYDLPALLDASETRAVDRALSEGDA